MFTASFRIKGKSQLSFSRRLFETKEDNETHDDYERRIWAEKAHFDSEGKLICPGIWLKKALSSTASLLGQKITGRGNKTFKDAFLSGVICPEDTYLMDGVGKKVLTKKELKPIVIPCSSDGKPNARSQVLRWFPLIEMPKPGWSCEFQVAVIDPEITQEVFKNHLERSGLQDGFGRWNPRHGGSNGRYCIENFTWKKS